jgi:hypothetical protein
VGQIPKQLALGGLIPNPAIIQTPQNNGTAQIGQLISELQAVIKTQTQYINATNSRIDRIQVTADAAELIKQGEIKQTQTSKTSLTL